MAGRPEHGPSDWTPIGSDGTDGSGLPVVSPNPHPELGRDSLIDQIGVAQDDPPVGLILIGWDPPEPAGPDPAPVLTLAEMESAYERQVERSVIFAVAGCAGRADRILASDQNEVAVVCSALRGPASAEALADRIARHLAIELDRLSIATDEPVVRWAIGVVVSRAGDEPADLLRHAETVLGDAWLLGGGQAVSFDGGKRGVINRSDHWLESAPELEAD